jgi:hypothetical protein
MECLFRFYSYGLEKQFNAQLFRDFEATTLQVRLDHAMNLGMPTQRRSLIMPVEVTMRRQPSVMQWTFVMWDNTATVCWCRKAGRGPAEVISKTLLVPGSDCMSVTRAGVLGAWRPATVRAGEVLGTVALCA